MSKRVIAVAGLATALTLALGAPAALASSAPPPPPVSTNGHPVQLVASGLNTPTAFAFGHGRGVRRRRRTPRTHEPRRTAGSTCWRTAMLASSPASSRFVAGLAWHHNKLYISGAALVPRPPELAADVVEAAGMAPTTFTVAQGTVYIAGEEVRRLQRPRLRRQRPPVCGRGCRPHRRQRPRPGQYVAATSTRSCRSGLYRLRTCASSPGGIRQPWQMTFPARLERALRH